MAYERGRGVAVHVAGRELPCERCFARSTRSAGRRRATCDNAPLVGSWLDRRRDVAIDSVVAYVAPRLALGAAIVLLLLLTVIPPVATAAFVALIWLVLQWVQEKKIPDVPSEAWGKVPRFLEQHATIGSAAP